MSLVNVAREVKYAPQAFDLLRGCVCLYKPSMKGFKVTRDALLNNLVNDLNAMQCRPMRKRIEIVGDSHKNLDVQVKPNLADHPLVSGPRYASSHIALKFVHHPGWYSSGLMIAFLGPQSHHHVKRFLAHNRRKLYEVRGEFGFASRNFRDDGKITGKANYKHLTLDRFHRVVAKLEAGQRHLMYKASGIRMGSEQAYEAILADNLLPPINEKLFPFVYSIQPLTFEPPHFSLQVECLHENELFLSQLIHRIGLGMRSLAMTTSIRLYKYGPFQVDNALLSKHWDLENVIENIYHNNQVIERFEQEMSQAKEQQEVH